MTTLRAVFSGALLLVSESVAAHGGGLDSNGCHHDRKRGGYHCHGGAAPRVPAPNYLSPATVPKQRLRGGDSDSTYYANCTAARAAGAAPVRRGEPGYGRHLDRDGDGIGCE